MFMAVEAINKNSSILAGHQIHAIILNGACEPAMVMRQFIEIIQQSSSGGFYNNLVSFRSFMFLSENKIIININKY